MIPGKKAACDCIEVMAISSPIREGRLNELSVVDSFLGNIPVAYQRHPHRCYPLCQKQKPAGQGQIHQMPRTYSLRVALKWVCDRWGRGGMTSQNATGWLACMIEFVSHNLEVRKLKVKSDSRFSKGFPGCFLSGLPMSKRKQYRCCHYPLPSSSPRKVRCHPATLVSLATPYIVCLPIQTHYEFGLHHSKQRFSCGH